MKKTRDFCTTLSLIAMLLASHATTVLAQSRRAVPATMTVPRSSTAKPGDEGKKVHTNVRFLRINGTPQTSGPPFPGYFYETPASIACIYNLQHRIAGCNPNVVTANPSGGSRAIAIVDAYDYSAAAADLATFDAQFGIATPSFTVVYAPFGGTTPGSCTGPATQPVSGAGSGWDIEAALDTQWSHAMAPSATLYLVEAQSDFDPDMYCAVSVASALVAEAGGGEVSMSWGEGEYPGETAFDSVLTTPKVVYFASAGDSPGPIYPSVSPNVVSAGGTSLSTNANTGTFEFENTWQDAGGGASAFESRPRYQNSVAYLVGTQRGTPDVAFDANPYTGVWVFNSTFVGFPAWFIVGGTSVSSPNWAGIVNTAGGFSASSSAELTRMYSRGSLGFTDIVYGTCGVYIGDLAFVGWDFCTGLGSPKTYAGK